MRALLQLAATTASSQFPFPPPATPTTLTTSSTDDTKDSYTADIVVVLAALLCAVICMAGLALINRCNNLRRNSSGNTPSSNTPQQQQQHHIEIQLPMPPPKRGLKKSALKALPKMRYKKEDDIEKQSECVICLTEFEEGEEIRKLPQCFHKFHVGCVDKWLRAQSSCPSCRRVLVVVPPTKQGGEKGGTRNKAVTGDSTSTFLP